MIVEQLPYRTSITSAGIADSGKLKRPSIIVSVWDVITKIVFCGVFGPGRDISQKLDANY
jgi:hypothetical protein